MPDISHSRSAPSARLRAAPAAPCDAASTGLLPVAAYLCLVNLDYTALWHDKAPATFPGKTLLQQRSIHLYLDTGLAVYVSAIVWFLGAEGVAYGCEA